MQRILIVGATSAIAEATARLFAARGDALLLAGRDRSRLQAIAADLTVRGASLVETAEFDARAYTEAAALLQTATERLGGLDAALIAHGTLSDQGACQRSIDRLREEFDVNALSVMALCTELANQFEAQGHGVIAVMGPRCRHVIFHTRLEDRFANMRAFAHNALRLLADQIGDET